MTIAEYVYNGIPDELRESVLRLYKDFGTRFLSRGREELDRFSELGILHRTPGSSPNAPSEYRFVPEALREIETLLGRIRSSETEWEEKPYTFDSRKADGQIRLFMPYREEFIELFSGRTFTHRDFLQFIATEGIKDFRYSNMTLHALFLRGLLRKRGYRYRQVEYEITDAALKAFVD